MPKHWKMYLAGKWVDRKGRIKVENPFDDSTVGSVASASKADMTKAIEAADKAFVKTRLLPSHVRYETCMLVSETLQRHSERFARMMALEVGKAIKDARGEVARAVQVFRMAGEEAKRIGGEIMDLDWVRGNEGRVGLIRRFPVGVVAGIAPFNFPLNLVAHKIAPAIASGNTIVLKPAPKTPIIALMLAELIDKTDYPKGAISVLPSSNEAAAPLIHDERVKVISFTGSDRVGWWIKEQAGKKKVVLELGGNAGVIVADDADLKYAVDRILLGGFGQAGQSCISVQRVFLQEKIYDKFLNAFIPKVKKLRVGDPLKDTTDIGTMVNTTAAENTRQLVDEAVAGGATLLAGGKNKGRLWQPTVLANVKSSMAVCRTEAFAPILAVSKYRTFRQAVDLVNDSDFGLQAGLFTNRLNDVFYAFNHVDAGGVVINDVPTFRADQQPYGGVKNSGIGREGVRYAIEDMTEIKILSMNLR
jgi:glyceraldehyde-3-phosphate dehydrogenase (NADP+)